MKKLLVLILLAGLVSCEKKDIENIDCEIFISALSAKYETAIKEEIEKLMVDLNPIPTDEDAIGHSGNIQTLIGRLNSDCDNYTASLLCYACIYTHPAQSEILIEFFYGGSKQEISILIHTPENDILRFAGVHWNIELLFHWTIEPLNYWIFIFILPVFTLYLFTVYRLPFTIYHLLFTIYYWSIELLIESFQLKVSI